MKNPRLWLICPSLPLVLCLPALRTVPYGLDSELKCSFTINDIEYNLCPLLEPLTEPITIKFNEDTPPTKNKMEYLLGLTGPLKVDTTLPEQLRCPLGTWICFTVTNTRPDHPSEPPRILQVVPVAGGSDIKPTAKLGTFEDPKDSNSLILHMHGGMYTNHTQKAAFQLTCDPSIREPSVPEYAWSWNGTHAFSWRTKHACPKQTAHDPPTDPDKAPADLPPKDDESESDTDLRPHSQRTKFSTYIIAVIVVSLSLILARVSYSFLSRLLRGQNRRHGYLPIPSLPSLSAASFRRHKRKRSHLELRPSPERLVSWAQQAGMTGDEEIDLMVNSNSFDADEDDLSSSGEEIPLSPSPRKSAFGMSRVSPALYGSFGNGK